MEQEMSPKTLLKMLPSLVTKPLGAKQQAQRKNPTKVLLVGHYGRPKSSSTVNTILLINFIDCPIPS